MATTRAKVSLSSLPQEEKKKIHKVKEQKLKTEKVTTIKKIEEKAPKEKAIVDIVESKTAKVEEVRVLATTKDFKEIIEEKTAVPKIPVEESVITSAIASCKKIDTTITEEVQSIEEKAKAIVPIQESVTVSEVTVESTVQEFGEKIDSKRVKKLTVEDEARMTVEVNELMQFINAKEFGPGENPLRELAQIGYMVRRGVTINEVTSLYETDKFPALRQPESQAALVQVIERQGHGTLISEILTEETTTNEDFVAETVGFRAFMRMVELKHATVEEVITHFAPEDFKSSVWKSTEAKEVVTTETLHKTIVEEVQTHVVDEKQVSKKIIKHREAEQEEAASLSITREAEVIDEQVEEIQDGDIVFSICSYVAETEEAINLVEGERVYIIENLNSDWWFVRKHLTEEKGWVPAQFLMDEVNYTLYVQKKLHEKIDKLPVFEKPGPDEKSSAPKFIEKLQPKHSPDGFTVQFECQVEGSPRPQITWFRQTAIIKPSQDFQIYYDEDNVATLIIREVFPEDAGTFTCVAKNAAGFASSTTELTVEAPLSDHGSDMTGLSRKSLSRESSLADILEGIPPTFSKKPRAQCVNEGTDVILECRLVAVPEPDIKWVYNGEEVKTEKNVTVVTESDMHMYCSVIKITKVKKNQEGTFEVIAKNREGESSMPIVLKVITGEQEPPQVLEPLRSLIVREGDSFVTSTQIVGNPVPKVTWYKNGVPIKNLSTKSERDTHTLTLISPKISDSGEYTVKAVNPMGTAETTATITVEECPSGNPEPPMFVDRFQEQNVLQNATVRLPAKVTGNPVPEITWLRNNKPLEPSPKIKLSYDGENIELVIKNADSELDSGDYKCVASNPIGKASHGAKVTVDVEKVKFTKKLHKSTTVNETETLTLECETSHTVSTKWFHNNKEVSGMDHREVIQEGRIHKLVIKKTKMTDVGMYKCTVRDQKTESQVTVKETKPEFIRKLQDFEVKEREIAVLEVEISSENANVMWKKDGEKLTDENKKLVFEKQGHIRKLLIREASVHDEGEYTCILADQECAAEVTVVELAPEIITKMQDVTIAKGEKAQFEIELTKGDALVRWFKDGKELQFSEHVQLSIDGKRQRLKIYNSEMEDDGEYMCQVGNQKSAARLTVEEPIVDFITRLPEVTLIPLNTDATFLVELSRPDVEVKWLINGKEIKKSPKYTIISEGTVQKLIVKKCVQDDQKEFTCVALNVKTSSKLKVEIIETAPKIIIDKLKKIYKVKQNEDVTFDVEYTSTVKPRDEWSTNGIILMNSKRVTTELTEASASLTIRKVLDDDVGDYKVTLKNNCGEASADLTLIIMKPPSQPGQPDPLEISNDSITLFWKAPEFDGNSPISHYILQYHDRDDFNWTSISDIKDTSYKVTSLIQNTDYMFRVIAVNQVGPSEPSNNTRYIKIAKSIANEAPIIQEPLVDTTSGIKQTVSLSCIIGGVPIPEIKWFRDGRPFKNKNMTYENRVAKYTITETTETSTGTYICKATNDAGFAETSCTLTIQERPRIDVEESLVIQKLRVTSQWKVQMTISGYPKPEVTWEKDGSILKSTKQCSILSDETTSTIAIYALARSDSGKYTITAKNSAGTVNKELTLRVIDKPSKPEGPMIMKEIRKESVTIEWKPPIDDGGLELSKYSIEKCDPEKMIWIKVADVDKDVETFCVQKLSEDSEYMFRVFAANPIGYSEALESDPVTVRTAFTKPSPPRGPLDVCGMTETSFTLKWQPSENDGGTPIIEYIVEMKETKSKTFKQIGISKAENTFLQISKLKKDVSYDFKIFARNEVGISLPFIPEESIIAGRRIIAHHPTLTIKQSPPSCPQNLQVIDVTSRSATLQWEPPASTGGTDLTGYIVEKRLQTTNKWTKVATLEPTCLQYCLENLKEKSEFVFRVFAENSIGLSEPATTEKVVLKTHATVPSPPTAPLEMRSVGPNSIIVEWGIPESDGGAPLEGYNIAIRDIKKTMWMEVGRVQAGVQKFTIKDLHENHEYLIRIFARNEVGLSDPLESEEPYKVLPSTVEAELDEPKTEEPTGYSTETTMSWMRENNMDADIKSYARGTLLRKDEYFFRIWHYAKELFK